MIAGVGVIILVVLVMMLTVGLVPARPAITMAFAGLVVAVGAVATFAFDHLLGAVTMVVGLAMAGVAVRRDAAVPKAQQPAAVESERQAGP